MGQSTFAVPAITCPRRRPLEWTPDRARPAVLRVPRDTPIHPLTLGDVVRRVAEDSRCAAEAMLRRDRQLTLDGLWLGGLPPILAALTHRLDAPLLLLVPHVAEAETVAADLAELTQRPVEVFPPGSEDSELESLTHQETAQRLHVLSQLYKYSQARHQSPSLEDLAPEPDPAAPRLAPIVVNHSAQHPAPCAAAAVARGGQAGDSIWRSNRFARPAALALEVGLPSIQLGAIGGCSPCEAASWTSITPDEPLPLRIELFDDEVESLRSFDVASQRSVEIRQVLHLLAATGSIQQDGCLLDYLPNDCLAVLHEVPEIQATANAFLHRVPFPQRYCDQASIWQRLTEFLRLFTSQLAADGYSGELMRLPVGSVERVGGDLERLAEDIDRHVGPRSVIVVAQNDGEHQRLSDLLAPAAARREQRLWIETSQLQSGFELLPDGPVVLTANQLLRRSHVRRVAKRIASRPIDNFLDLRPGDLVVHLSHGIGIYRGTELLDKNGQRFEHLAIEFDGGTKLYVPSSKIELVQRYVVVRVAQAGQDWQQLVSAKEGSRASSARWPSNCWTCRPRAASLISLHRRQHLAKPVRRPFAYVETPTTAGDRSGQTGHGHPRPMDRLICGDVGFGKTEFSCGQPSRRSTTVIKKPCWCRPRSWPNSFQNLQSGWLSFRLISKTQPILLDRRAAANHRRSVDRAGGYRHRYPSPGISRRRVLQPRSAGVDDERVRR